MFVLGYRGLTVSRGQAIPGRPAPLRCSFSSPNSPRICHLEDFPCNASYRLTRSSRHACGMSLDLGTSLDQFKCGFSHHLMTGSCAAHAVVGRVYAVVTLADLAFQYINKRFAVDGANQNDICSACIVTVAGNEGIWEPQILKTTNLKDP